MVSSQQEPTAQGKDSDELVAAPDNSWVKKTKIRGPRKNSGLNKKADEPREPRG